MCMLIDVRRIPKHYLYTTNDSREKFKGKRMLDVLFYTINREIRHTSNYRKTSRSLYKIKCDYKLYCLSNNFKFIE